MSTSRTGVGLTSGDVTSFFLIFASLLSSSTGWLLLLVFGLLVALTLLFLSGTTIPEREHLIDQSISNICEASLEVMVHSGVSMC